MIDWLLERESLYLIAMKSTLRWHHMASSILFGDSILCENTALYQNGDHVSNIDTWQKGPMGDKALA